MSVNTEAISEDQIKAVNAVVEKVRPFIQMHGGDVSVTAIRDGVAHLVVSGSCAHCSLADLTYNKMLRSLLCKEVPGIVDVVLDS
jgi:Fe-S cluster biogenesis protein NfuA